MQNRVLANLDEGLELFVYARVDPGVGVVGEELLPLLVGDPVGVSRAQPLPAVVVVGRRDPRSIEAGSVVAHRVLRSEMVAPGADLADAIHREALVVEGNP